MNGILLGDDLVPDFFTSVRDGGFYGWPYSYIGPELRSALCRRSRTWSSERLSRTS